MNVMAMANTLSSIRESKNFNEMETAMVVIRPFVRSDAVISDPNYLRFAKEIVKSLKWIEEVEYSINSLTITVKMLLDEIKEHKCPDRFLACTFKMQSANLLGLVGCYENCFENETIEVMSTVDKYIDACLK